MLGRLLSSAAALAVASTLVGTMAAPAAAAPQFDHVFVLVMENQSFDLLVGRDKIDGNGNPSTPDTPFITELAKTRGINTFYFGVTHPSLPNYLSMVSGDYFRIQDDNPSCFAQPNPGPTCDVAKGDNIVDTLEKNDMTWSVLEQSMPTPGYLGVTYPASGSPTLYAQKHNPFVYFPDVAKNPTRLAKIVPWTDKSLAQNVANPPNFTYLVPDQCHDMHGTSTCADLDSLLQAGDDTVKKTVLTVTNSPKFTQHSVLFVVWDEDDYSSNLGCCDSLPHLGGGHTLALAITKDATPRRSAVPANHYSLLRTIEAGLGLPFLGHSADSINVPTLFDLL